MTRLLALIGALAIAGAVVVAGFFFGGFFNIAASENDPPFVAQQIVRVRVASIARHATDRPPANFGEAARVQAGAKLFAASGCAQCHGAPGVGWAKFSEGLNPDPPDLKKEAGNLEPQEVFWIVKHGIRMTGMPSFAAAGVSDDDIWSIAAFVKKIASVSEADYAAWTAPAASVQPPAPPPAPAVPAPAAPAPAEQPKQ
ncbi:MAG: cytochrome c [Beijerinckiaceae bacterium]